MSTPKIPSSSTNVEPIHDGLVRVLLGDGTLAFRRRGLRFGRDMIGDTFMIDADRTGLFVVPKPARRAKDKADDKPAPEPVPVEARTGLPVLLRCIMPRDRPEREGAVPSELRYEICRRFPDGRVTPPEWFNAAEIRKGEHLEYQGVAITGRRGIDDDARVIFAQLHPSFGVPVETPWRHSGFTGTGLAEMETPHYVAHCGRGMLPGGRVAAGSIDMRGGLLQPRRKERWEERLKTIPMPPPSAAQAAAAISALLTFDPYGRALCAAFLGARSLFYSLRPMNVTCLLTGLRGSGKTTIGQILHWAEGPCAAGDEPDMSFRTTALGVELMADKARDCAFLIDDGERLRPNDPGSPLKPDVVSIISNRTREAFDGAPAKVRGGRSLALAETRRVAQLQAFSAETALGLEASVLARTIWWTFEAGEIAREPMLSGDWEETPTWAACSDVFTGCGHAAIRQVLDLWSSRGRADAVGWIREIDLEAGALAYGADLGGEDEDRSRVQRGLAMIIAGAMLCDVGAGTENMFRDLALAYGADLARAQLDRLASGTTATVGFDGQWFREAIGELVASGDQLWLDASTGRFLTGEDGPDSHLIGLGYQWRPEHGFVPSARTRGGWLADDAYLAEPGALLSWFDRRLARKGGAFPFDRQTLPGHLVREGIAERAPDGRNVWKPWLPLSDAKYPDKGARLRVIRIPFDALDAKTEPEERGTAGKRGTAPASHWDRSTSEFPASPPASGSGEAADPPAGKSNPIENQSLTEPSPRFPAVPAQNAYISRTNERWPERAAVIGADGLWIGGENHPAPEVSSLADLASLAIERQLTQLWVHPSLVALDLPEALTPSEARAGLDHPFAAGDLPEGWRFAAPGKVKAWNRVTTGGQDVQIILSAFDGGTWPFGEASTGGGQMAAIEAFRAAVGGFHPRLAPAVTFEAMLRALHKGGTDLSASVATFPAPMLKETVDQCWLAPAGAGAFVIAADKSAAYLAAMSSLAVGFGEPGYEAGPAFDARRAGYWRAKVTLPPDWPSPFPLIGKAKPDWFVTPSLTLAAQAGARIEVSEAWIFPATHRPFEPVYSRLRDARGQLQAQSGEAAALALAAVKSLYTRGVGNLAGRAKREAGEPVDLHRPDWRQFIVAQAQADVIRNLRKAGLRPFGLRTDAIYLTAETPDLAAAAPGLKLGVTPGLWRPLGGALAAADLPAAYRSPTPARAAQGRLDALTEILRGA